MSSRHNAIFILGPSALALAQQVKSSVGGSIHGPAGLAGTDVTFDSATTAMGLSFQRGECVVGICAAGILIRAVAPLLKDKQQDAPVIAIAEDGASVVPLLGGHHGANDVARTITSAIAAHAAITTASDVSFGASLDEPEHATLANPQHHKSAAAARLAGESITLDTTIHPMAGGPTHLVYHPHVLAVGIGCERGTTPEEVKTLLDETLAANNLAPEAIAAFASIDLKEDEPALNQFANVRYFTADQLNAEAGRIATPSAIVAQEVGTPSVAEAAALALAGPASVLIVPKQKSKRATIAIAHAPNQQAISESAGRPRGRVSVVGIGPGSPATRSPAASAALWQATDWVGYGLYMDLASDLFRHQVRHDFPLGGEEARCRHAIELAKEGKQVALVCSGDAGIYAMAALVYELIDREPCRVAVEVHPGISAFQLASAKAGAMIGHDFCCISLSDLLTPWETIVQRVTSAAEGDFVISFYNPRSLKRTDQIAKAFDILRPHRNPDTPVILASNLGRVEEHVRIIRFDQFRPEDVDMLTLVMVGSSQSKSFVRGDGQFSAYTPRGYAKKMSPT
jgi:cobalt-precorrin 5A hydrolase / precorrin-3B C17-methyltransferase